MTEFIINSDQLEQLIEGIEHKTDREINRVVCNDKELPSIVRCRDCLHYSGYSASHAKEEIGTCNLGLEWTELYSLVESNGFCAWGKRYEG